MTNQKCQDCGTRPVDPNTQGRDSTMCTECFDYAGWENTHSDENHNASPEADTIRTGCLVCHPELDPRNQPATAPKPRGKRPAKQDQPCRCSANCGASTRNAFAPGHDARMVSLLVKRVLATEIDAEVAATQIREAGGNAALVNKFQTALANAAAKAAQPKRTRKPAGVRVSPNMVGALQLASAQNANGSYAEMGSIRTGTCVALLDRGLLDFVRDPETGAVVGHKITNAGRAALADATAEA